MTLIIPNLEKGKNKRRHAMPQIDDFDAFIKDLESEGISVTTIAIPASELIPTQGNFSEDKVNKLLQNDFWKKKPIITSDDDYILDGHHRWLAAAQIKKAIKCRVIGMKIDALLKFVKDKPYVGRRGLHESVSPELERVQNYFAKIARTAGTSFAEVLNKIMSVREKIQDNKELAIQQKAAIMRLLDRMDGLVTK